MHFAVQSPAMTDVREADLIATIKDAGGAVNGELYLRSPVMAQIVTQITPMPPSGDNTPSVKLTVKNNGAQSQDVTWKLAVDGQIALTKGTYAEKLSPSDSYFASAPSGRLSVAAGEAAEVAVPLGSADPQNVYHVSATVADATGREVSRRSRYVAGFVAVPKARGKITPDGVLDEDDWKRAPVEAMGPERGSSSRSIR